MSRESNDRYASECDCCDVSCAAGHGEQCHAEWREQVFCCGAPDCVATRLCVPCAEDAIKRGGYTRSLGELHHG